MRYDDPPVSGIWAGQPQWRCPYCAFDSLEEDRVRQHIQWAHPADPELVVTAPQQKEVKRGKNDANQDG